MAFLAPLFLLGLAALAVPVLVHLIQRERKTPIEFPSLMFVRRIPYQSVQRRRITNWPLFLLRCAAVVLIVLAFSRPFLSQTPVQAALATSGARDVVILLDRSASRGSPPLRIQCCGGRPVDVRASRAQSGACLRKE
jgi:hypothetical protein